MQTQPESPQPPASARQTDDPDRRPPGPAERSGGIFESLRYFYNFATDSIGFVGSRFEQYGDLYYAPSKGTGLFVVRHPDHLVEVLMTKASRYRKTHSAFERLGEVLGQGLLNTDGEAWKRQRRLVQPAFNKKRLASYAGAMTEEAVKSAEMLTSGETRDVGRDMMELTLRVVSRTLFSHDVRNDTDSVADAMRAFNDALSRPDLLPSWFPSPSRARAHKSLRALDEVVYRVIDERAALNDERTGDAQAPDDLLQALVTAVDDEGDGRGLSRTEIRDQLVTLFLAGHETTSHALTWTWYLLSQNPGVRHRLHRELDEVLDGRVPTFEDLLRLKYTEQVLLESMRLYPPAYVVARRAHQDTEIGGYRVPAGSEVVMWIYHTHHDPRWWPEPEAFRPERFEPEAIATRPKLSYLPFGAGPRACVGQHFSIMESKLILATLASRFSFDLAPGHRVAMKPRVTLTPKNGMRMSVRGR